MRFCVESHIKIDDDHHYIESVLVVSHILAEKCDIENANNPETRAVALEMLQRVMFGPNNPIAKSLVDKAKKEPEPNIFKNLPPKGTVNRQWLDIATNKQEGPSNYDFDDPEPSHRGKPTPDPQFGANDPNNSIPQNPDNNPSITDHNNPNSNINPEEYDDFVDYEGNNQDPKWVDPYTNDPDKNRRHKGRPKDIMLKYPYHDNGMIIIQPMHRN